MDPLYDGIDCRTLVFLVPLFFSDLCFLSSYVSFLYFVSFFPSPMICFEIDIILINGFMSAGLSDLIWFRLVYRDSVTLPALLKKYIHYIH